MLKFISAVIAAAAFAGVLTLLSATSTRLDAGPARDASPQSSPFTQTAPTLAATAMSPELVRLEVARDLAAMRDSIDQLAAKQEQMAQTIATLQAAQEDIIQTRSSEPVSGASRHRHAKKREGLGNSTRSRRLCLPRRSLRNDGCIQAAHESAIGP
jgi:hypothetical protein